VNNVKQANINIKLKNLFFKWLEITKPLHKLTQQEQDVLALLLYYLLIKLNTKLQTKRFCGK